MSRPLAHTSTRRAVGRGEWARLDRRGRTVVVVWDAAVVKGGLRSRSHAVTLHSSGMARRAVELLRRGLAGQYATTPAAALNAAAQAACAEWSAASRRMRRMSRFATEVAR